MVAKGEQKATVFVISASVDVWLLEFVADKRYFISHNETAGNKS
jgi:hypothetical protein